MVKVVMTKIRVAITRGVTSAMEHKVVVAYDFFNEVLGTAAPQDNLINLAPLDLHQLNP
jgi:hypothetical protein